MAFNPYEEKGKPIDKQIRNWSELNVAPYTKTDVHPHTRTRIILMNGVEVEAAIFTHQLARHTKDPEMRKQLAMMRRVEQQQQKMINWMSPGNETTLEVTIGYEQVAVDLTAFLAKTVKDQNVKSALDFALLEDFDHLYRYANLLDMQGKDPAKIVGEYTEIFPGRPTVTEHQHPYDTLQPPGDSSKMDPLSMLHVHTIVAGEQQTMNFYMNVGREPEEKLARGLYLEIGMIEEQHVSRYESLIDPTMSWMARLLAHEYHEVYMYYSCLESETDGMMKKHWEQHLMDELTHFQTVAEMYKKEEGKDPEEMCPPEFPQLTVFESGKDYVRKVIEDSVDQTTVDNEWKTISDLPEDSRFKQFQSTVNVDGSAPSQDVVAKRIRDKGGKDYRHELEGEHPKERFRTRDKVVK